MLELIRQANKPERTWFTINVIVVAGNIGLALVLPDGWATSLNWFVAGLCTATAMNLILLIRWRLLLDRQNNIIWQANNIIATLLASDYYENKLKELIDKAKHDGVIPPDVELFKIEPKLH